MKGLCNCHRTFRWSQAKTKQPYHVGESQNKCVYILCVCVNVSVWAIFPVQWFLSHLWHSGSELLSCSSFDPLFPFLFWSPLTPTCSDLQGLSSWLQARGKPHEAGYPRAVGRDCSLGVISQQEGLLVGTMTQTVVREVGEDARGEGETMKQSCWCLEFLKASSWLFVFLKRHSTFPINTEHNGSQSS